jgi:hypothetical protein
VASVTEPARRPGDCELGMTDDLLRNGQAGIPAQPGNGFERDEAAVKRWLVEQRSRFRESRHIARRRPTIVTVFAISETIPVPV